MQWVTPHFFVYLSFIGYGTIFVLTFVDSYSTITILVHVHNGFGKIESVTDGKSLTLTLAREYGPYSSPFFFSFSRKVRGRHLYDRQAVDDLQSTLVCTVHRHLTVETTNKTIWRCCATLDKKLLHFAVFAILARDHVTRLWGCRSCFTAWRAARVYALLESAADRPTDVRLSSQLLREPAVHCRHVVGRAILLPRRPIVTFPLRFAFLAPIQTAAAVTMSPHSCRMPVVPRQTRIDRSQISQVVLTCLVST